MGQVLRALLLIACVQYCYCYATSRSSSSSSRAAAEKKAAEAAEKKRQLCLNAVPVCVPVTANVSTNIVRSFPCTDGTPCVVVVNDVANTTKLCSEWSPYSYWDGGNCQCRCELLGGVLMITMGEKWCKLGGRAVVLFEKFVLFEEYAINSAVMYETDVNVDLYLAPIKCGTWLGVRDSVKIDSWYSSSCFSILKNRYELSGIAEVSECGIDKYTTGCRRIGPWVPECRKSDVGECGVQMPCPANPCGLRATIDDNLKIMSSKCKSQTYLALNVTATRENCRQWTEYAFMLGERCVSACGIVNYQCVLGGLTVPDCITKLDSSNSTIISISPAVCSVPVQVDVFGGVRNGFFGMSRALGSKCMYSTNCTNASACSVIEGINVSIPTNVSSGYSLPHCVGDHSEICKIEYPCPPGPVPFTCGATISISEAIYTKLGIYDCNWISGRDIAVNILWVVSVFVSFGMVKWRNNYNRENGPDPEPGCCYSSCVFICVYLVLMGLSCVWEFSIPAIGLFCLVVAVRQYLSNRSAYHALAVNSSGPGNTQNVAAVALDRFKLPGMHP